MVVRKPYHWASLSVSCFDWFLVRGISFLSVQVFVIAIENILQSGVGNLSSRQET